MTVLHTGSTKKFASGWENVFSGHSGRTAKPTAKPAAKKAAATAKTTSGTKRSAAAGKKQPKVKSVKRG